MRSVQVGGAITLLALVVLVGMRADGTGAAVPAPYGAFYANVNYVENGSNVVLWTNTIPTHGSPYFFPNDPLYEPYNGTNPNWAQNPNHISAQSIVFSIPENPAAATVHQATALGPIGIALNGVPFFNQYAGPNQPLTNEINSFDQYLGHPQQTGMYHYHEVPESLIAQNGADSLLGFLLDGFPVYGPLENGNTLTSADLDQYHGHFGATAEYPQGIYHYHTTYDAPYLNGNGYYGTPGTVQLNAATVTATPTAAPTATPSPTPTPAPTDADGDGVPDAQDNCPRWPNAAQNLPPWSVVANDADCDGFDATTETRLMTDPNDACPNTATANDETDDRWPADFTDNQLINTLDLTVYAMSMNKPSTDGAYVARADLNGNGVINTLDLVPYAVMLAKMCSP